MNYTKIMLDNLEHPIIVKKCLEKGADVNASDNEALRYASSFGYAETVKVLLEAGADANKCGDLTLRFASMGGYIEIINLLKQYKTKE